MSIRNASQIEGPHSPWIYDVRDFGAVADCDITTQTGTDNLAAFQAAIDAMNVAVADAPSINGAAWYGAKLYIPGGQRDATNGVKGYYLSDSLVLSRQIIVEGDGGYGWHANTYLQFAKGKTGIKVAYPDTTVTPNSGKYGAWSIIRNLRLRGYYQSCTPPSIDGGDYYLQWLPTHAYSVGDVVSFTTTRLNIDGFALQCTVAGTSGSTEPDIDSSIPATFTDGTVTWAVVEIHGIDVRARAKIENVFIDRFAGNGINLAAGVPASNASVSFAGHCRIENCGGNGLIARSNDSNACLFMNIDASHNSGYGFVDNSFLNNTHVAHHTNGNLRGSYYGTHGIWDGCYAEGGQGAIFVGASAAWKYGVAGSGNMDLFVGYNRPAWQASHTYASQDFVQPTVANGYYYWTSGGGVSSGTQPTWPIGRGKTVIDGTVTWYCYGLVQSLPTTATIDNGGDINSSRDFTNREGAHLTRFGAGLVAHPEVFMRWQSDGDTAASDYRLSEDKYGVGWQCLTYGNDGPDASHIVKTPFQISDNRATGTGEAAGMLQLASPFFIGSQYPITLDTVANQGERIRVWSNRQAPTTSTGYWPLGSRVFNSAPSELGTAGSKYVIVGWICVTAGTPGTWLPMRCLTGN